MGPGTFCLWVFVPIGSLSNSDDDGYKKKIYILKFTLVQTLSHLLQLVQFFKCWKSFRELNSKRLYQSSGKEKESQCVVFTSLTKREIRHMLRNVIVVQQWQRNVQKW